MIAELTQTVSRVERNQLEITQAVQSLVERVRMLAEQQATLIELLTPKDQPKKDGPGLDELLAAIVVRLDTQNHLLKDVSDVVSKAVTALPLSVVEAIADAFQPADPVANTPRNGHQGGAA